MPRLGWLSVALCLVALAPRAGAEPERVTVGAYLHDIQDVSLATHSYAADLYVWFRWRDPELDPASSVEFVNAYELWGHTVETTYDEPVELPSGELYQVLRVQGRFSKKLPLHDYPFDRQELLVAFEDSAHESQRLVYVADEAPVAVNPALVLPGFAVGAARFGVESYAYPTRFGDPRPDRAPSYARARLVLLISRPVWAYALKLLLPVLCVVGCAALMLIVAPRYVDARLGVGITSLLTVVALQITTNEDLPEVAYLVLIDKVYLCAYLFVIGGLILVVKSSGLVEQGDEQAARALQRKGLAAGLSLFGLALLALVVPAVWG